MSKFTELYKVDVNDKIDNVQGKTYLSWAWAWSEFKKIHPDANYKIKKNKETNLPYFADDTGIIVYTKVYADNLSYEMWLPVMNSSYKAMKLTEYTYKTKQGEKKVLSATMIDINKAIMRCLTKNLAMFGLGLYIYAREDYPDIGFDQELISNEQIKLIDEKIKLVKADKEKFLKVLGVVDLSDLYLINYDYAINLLIQKEKKNDSVK